MSAHTSATELSADDIFRHAADGIFAIDRHRRVVMFSHACERIIGIDKASVIGTSCPCEEITGCRDETGRPLSGPLCPALEILDGGMDGAHQRMTIEHPDRRRTWIENTYSPVFDEAGAVAFVVGIMRNVTDRQGGNPSTSGRGAILSAHPDGAPDAGSGQRPGGNPDGPLDRILSSVERREILSALSRARGQRTEAARILGISRSRLYRRMEALGIDPKQTDDN